METISSEGTSCGSDVDATLLLQELREWIRFHDDPLLHQFASVILQEDDTTPCAESISSTAEGQVRNDGSFMPAMAAAVLRRRQSSGNRHDDNDETAAEGRRPVSPAVSEALMNLCNSLRSRFTMEALVGTTQNVTRWSNDYTSRVRRHFEKYSPDKLLRLAETMAKHKGREDELIERLVKFYGPEPTPCGSLLSLPVSDDRRRLVRFYTHYKPDKLQMVDAILDHYEGKYNLLIDALVQKYGPEPPTTGFDGQHPVCTGLLTSALLCNTDLADPAVASMILVDRLKGSLLGTWHPPTAGEVQCKPQSGVGRVWSTLDMIRYQLVTVKKAFVDDYLPTAAGESVDDVSVPEEEEDTAPLIVGDEAEELAAFIVDQAPASSLLGDEFAVAVDLLVSEAPEEALNPTTSLGRLRCWLLRHNIGTLVITDESMDRHRTLTSSDVHSAAKTLGALLQGTRVWIVAFPIPSIEGTADRVNVLMQYFLAEAHPQFHPIICIDFRAPMQGWFATQLSELLAAASTVEKIRLSVESTLDLSPLVDALMTAHPTLSRVLITGTTSVTSFGLFRTLFDKKPHLDVSFAKKGAVIPLLPPTREGPHSPSVITPLYTVREQEGSSFVRLLLQQQGNDDVRVGGGGGKESPVLPTTAAVRCSLLLRDMLADEAETIIHTVPLNLHRHVSSEAVHLFAAFATNVLTNDHAVEAENWLSGGGCNYSDTMNSKVSVVPFYFPAAHEAFLFDVVLAGVTTSAEAFRRLLDLLELSLFLNAPSVKLFVRSVLFLHFLSPFSSIRYFVCLK